MLGFAIEPGQMQLRVIRNYVIERSGTAWLGSLDRAADQGHARAMNLVARCYEGQLGRALYGL